MSKNFKINYFYEHVESSEKALIKCHLFEVGTRILLKNRIEAIGTVLA